MTVHSNLILTGMMGAGKSTVGRLLAAELGKEYVDLDEFIEQHAKLKVHEIFACHGEPYFRTLEKQMLAKVLAQPNKVISTGGGVVTQADNLELMQKHIVVWLAIDSETASKRLVFDGTRPLLAGQSEHLQAQRGKTRIESYGADGKPIAGESGNGEAKKPLANWKRLEQERRRAYSLCDLVVDGSLAVDELVEEISHWWRQKSNLKQQGISGHVEHLTVQAQNAVYPIHIGYGVLDNLGRRCLYQHMIEKVLVVSNPTVYGFYQNQIEASLKQANIEFQTVLLPDGEQFKHVETVQAIYEAALDMGLDRQSAMIAFGGGVVGDITGFAAATFMRGIRLIQVPTTLLAQVDSSVGGKVGVNHPRGKNLIGAFYQPVMVAADLDTLKTLPRRQFLTGIAEVIKYGLIYDAVLVKELEKYAGSDVPRQILLQWVKRCCDIKAQVGAEDAREMGLREILNFGHTVGHGIEQAAGYGQYTHGEAVAIGMVTAAILSNRRGYLSDHDCRQVVNLLKSWELPTIPDQIPIESVIMSAKSDKKVRQGRLRFILLNNLGEAKNAEVVNSDELRKALKLQKEGYCAD